MSKLFHKYLKSTKLRKKRYIKNIGYKLEILYRFLKINIAQHYYYAMLRNFQKGANPTFTYEIEIGV